MAPERLAHESQPSGEGGVLFVVPCRPAGGDGFPLLQDMGGHHQPAEEAQQGRGGAENRLVRPLTLCFHAQVGAHRLKGHFHGPTPQVPGEELGRRAGGVGTEQGLGFLGRGGVPDQQPAQGYRGVTRVIPDGRIGDLCQVPHCAVRPCLLEGDPLCRGIGRYGAQGGPTVALETRPPQLPRRPRWPRRIKGGIQPQAGQEGEGRFHLRAGGQQAQGRVALVAADHQAAVGPPAPHTTPHRARPVRDGLVPPVPLGRVAGGGRQHGQKGEGPDPPRPRHRDPPHQADPPQTHRLHEVPPGGPHPVPIDPFGRNPRPLAAFNGFVDTQAQGPCGRPQMVHPQAQPDPAHLQCGPHRPAEYMVVPGEIPLRMQTQYLQSRGYGALAGRQHGPHPQHLGLRPGPHIKERSERWPQTYKRGRQRWHDGEPL